MYVQQDRSLPELFAELKQEVSTLVKQEIALAKQEMSGKGSRMAKGAGMLAAGGVVAYIGTLAIVGGIIFLLALFIPLWISAMLVGLVLVVTGYIVAQQGLKTLKQEDLVPHKTVATLKRIGNGSDTTYRRAA